MCTASLESSFVSTTIVGGRGVMKSSSKSCDNLQKFLGRAVQQKEIEPSMRIRVVDSISMACKNALVNKKIVSSVYTVYTLSPLFIMYNFFQNQHNFEGLFSPAFFFKLCIDSISDKKDTLGCCEWDNTVEKTFSQKLWTFVPIQSFLFEAGSTHKRRKKKK